MMWKNIHMELEFHNFIFLLLPCVVLTQCSSSTLQIWRADRPIAHPVFNCSIDQIGAQAFFVLCSSSILRSPDCSSSDLFFVKSFFFCSSSKLFFFKYKNRVLETRFRTRVYKTWDLCGIILPTHQVEIESLTLEF